MTILLTGGKGFIGSHMLMKLCSYFPTDQIVNLDFETYAARPPLYLRRPPNLVEVKADIRDQLAVHRVMREFKPEKCVHMAAESHVCRSITGPKDFVTTNVVGTFNVLEEFRDIGGKRFVHVSTDEVFGEIRTGHFTEDSPMLPRNPYAASKASSDLIVRSYCETYGMDAMTVNMANNFGPNQHHEKLIPRTILRILKGKSVIIHGKGDHIREWLYVEDAAQNILKVLEFGKGGDRYCLPGQVEYTNLEMVKEIHAIIHELVPASEHPLNIDHTDDRPTDDYRYAMRGGKMKWDYNPMPFSQKLKLTVEWYLHAMMHRGGRAFQGRGA